MATNQFGLDARYFKQQLELIAQSAENYTPLEMRNALMRMVDVADHAVYENPPCIECGAKTEKEAESMCICAGDKDNCHGQHRIQI